MKASEYIKEIESLISQHGDLQVVNEDDLEVSPPEFNNDVPGPGVFIVSS